MAVTLEKSFIHTVRSRALMSCRKNNLEALQFYFALTAPSVDDAYLPER